MARRPGVARMKVVVLAGPESSGKSWLAAELQAHFGGLMVGEYVRYFIDHHQRDTTLADIPASPVARWPGKTTPAPSSLNC